MDLVKAALKELKQSLVIASLFSAAVDSIFIFLISLFVLVILGLNWEYAMFPTILYFFVIFYLYLKNRNFRFVETRVRGLSEKLRTVADNVELRNEMIDDLKIDVLKDMRHVRVSYFINFRRLFFNLLGMGLFSLVILMVSFLNVNLEDINLPFGIDAGKGFRLGFGDDKSVEPVYYEVDISTSGAVYGDVSLAKLGNKELDLKIKPMESEIDITKVQELVKRKQFKAGDYPKEIYSRYDISYTEKIPKENQDIIKNYFKEITKEEQNEA